MVDDYDRYLSEDNDAQPVPDDGPVITEDMVTAICLAIETSITDAMVDINHLVITLTKPRTDGPVIWGATLRGVTIMYDSFEQFVEALTKLK